MGLFLFFFPCSADHDERDWPPCKVVFSGLATNALNVRNNVNINNYFKYCLPCSEHEKKKHINFLPIDACCIVGI